MQKNVQDIYIHSSLRDTSIRLKISVMHRLPVFLSTSGGEMLMLFSQGKNQKIYKKTAKIGRLDTLEVT